MSAVLAVVLWVLLALVLVIALVLLTPVEIRLDARAAPNRRVRVGAAPLAGHFPSIPIYDSTKPRKPKPKPEKPKARKVKRPKKGGMRSSRVFSAGVTLFGDILREIHVVRLRADAEFGLADPAETGELYGQLTPFVFGIPGQRVTLRPRFDGPTFAGEAEAAVRLTPARLLPPAVRFAWRAFGPG